MDSLWYKMNSALYKSDTAIQSKLRVPEEGVVFCKAVAIDQTLKPLTKLEGSQSLKSSSKEDDRFRCSGA